MFCRSLFVLLYFFLLTIVLPVLLRYADSDYPFGIFKLFLRICWIVPNKYLLLLDQTILLQFRSSIDRPLNLPQYLGSNNYFSIPKNIYIINNRGLMKKTYFGWSGAYFIFILYNCCLPTYHRFSRQRLLPKHQNVI
jgi:hypothetical protein